MKSIPRKSLLPFIALIVATLLLPSLTNRPAFISLWPAFCALSVIILTRHAALGLASGVVAGAFLIDHGDPIAATRAIFADYLFPSLDGTWHIGAIIFTLLLGAFAGILEKSGSFDTILARLTAKARHPQKRLLGGVYAIGLLCFFDGLANSLLTGRIARPLADRTGVSRERLAWVVDSTSSPVACVAFISTWIATQLSLIKEGLAGAPFPVEPYSLYFASIPANPYCLLTLILIPLAIFLNYQPRAMRRYLPRTPVENDDPQTSSIPARHAIIPLVALVLGIFAAFPLLSSPPNKSPLPHRLARGLQRQCRPLRPRRRQHLRPRHCLVHVSEIPENTRLRSRLPGRRKPPSRPHHPHPRLVTRQRLLKPRRRQADRHTPHGKFPSRLAPPSHLPLRSHHVIRHRLLMGHHGTPHAPSPPRSHRQPPPAAGLGSRRNAVTSQPAIIGAVFGGAVFGDHCSPFSDTTIVSSIASGCEPTAHVYSQLPFAALAATFAAALLLPHRPGPPPHPLATLIAALLMATTTFFLSRKKIPSSPS